MPYFLAIGQPIAEILRFNDFQMVVVRHLKFDILTGLLCLISAEFRADHALNPVVKNNFCSSITQNSKRSVWVAE